MKLTILLVLSNLCFIATAQVTGIGNFKVDNRTVVWQKVYECSGDANQITKDILTQGPFTNVDTVAKTCKIDDYKLSYRKYGLTFFETPDYLSDGVWIGSVRIEVKPNKYRVTITNLQNYTTIVRKKTDDKIVYPGKQNADELFCKDNDGSLKYSEVKYIKTLSDALGDLFLPVKPMDDNW